jgi:hypothetical protein
LVKQHIANEIALPEIKNKKYLERSRMRGDPLGKTYESVASSNRSSIAKEGGEEDIKQANS